MRFGLLVFFCGSFMGAIPGLVGFNLEHFDHKSLKANEESKH